MKLTTKTNLKTKMTTVSRSVTERLVVDLPPDHAATIKLIAKGRGLTVSDWLREQIAAGLVLHGIKVSPTALSESIRLGFTRQFSDARAAAIKSQALLYVVSKMLEQSYLAEGVTPELAQKAAQAEIASAEADAEYVLSDPAVIQMYANFAHEGE